MTEIEELRQELSCPEHGRLASGEFMGRTEYPCGCVKTPSIPSLDSKLEQLRTLEAQASKFAAIAELQGLDNGARLGLEEVRKFMQKLGYKNKFEGDAWSNRQFRWLRQSLESGKSCSPAEVLALVETDMAAARQQKEQEDWERSNQLSYASAGTVTCRCNHRGQPDKVRRAGSPNKYELVCTECGRIVLHWVEDIPGWTDDRLGRL